MPQLLRRVPSSQLLYKLYSNHNITVITLTAAAAASSLLYYYIHTTHTRSAHIVESLRKKGISKRKSLKRPEEKYASLKIDKLFVNPFEEWTEIPFYKTALFWLGRWKGNGIPCCEKELSKTLPVMKPDLNQIKHGDAVTFTWFGQSTCLMTIDGLTILSDPVFSKCSINDYLGPKRLRPIPCQLEDFIEDVDIVVVSHDHFDHLDETAVSKLGNSVVWYIPLGLKNWFLKRGVTNVIELDWWQEACIENRPDMKVACVPAMHWSGSRTPFEKNNTLWCSYVIKGKSDKIFFCGDTGYCPDLFKAIGTLYAPFKLAAIPIGSFMPTHLMQHLHMGPEDAVKAHMDLGCPDLSVGIHWGTFMMSDEHYLAPREVLGRVWESYIKDIVPIVEDEDLTSIASSSSSTITNSLTKLDTETKFITTAFGQTITLD